MPRLCHAGNSLQDLQEDSSDSDDVARIVPTAKEASLGAQEHVNGQDPAKEGNGSDESGSSTSEEAESSGDEDAQGTVQAAIEVLPVAGPAPLQIQAG